MLVIMWRLWHCECSGRRHGALREAEFRLRLTSHECFSLYEPAVVESEVRIGGVGHDLVDATCATIACGAFLAIRLVGTLNAVQAASLLMILLTRRLWLL